MKSGAMEVLRNIRATNASTTGTFSEVQCSLALSLESSFLYYVTGVHVALDTLNAIDTSCIIQWQIARNTQSAIVGYQDSDILWKGGFEIVMTTSGATIGPLTDNRQLPHPYAVAAPTLYFGILGTGTAGNPTMSLNLEYYPQKVSQQQFWEASQTR